MAAGQFIVAGNFGSPMQLLILLAIVLLLFGGKRLRNLGGDIGGALKGFKSAMNSTETRTEEFIQHQQQLVHSQNSDPYQTSDLNQTNELDKNRRTIGG